MVLDAVVCPKCKGSSIRKYGKNRRGKQRYQCLNPCCDINTFVEEYSYRGRMPEVKIRIIEMIRGGRGIRETARILGVSPSTVISELKKHKNMI